MDDQLGSIGSKNDRASLHAIRELHIEALTRMFRLLSNAERFEELSIGQLRVNKERIQSHFDSMEKAHVLYRQTCLLSSDDIYRKLEIRSAKAMARIEDRLEELGRLAQIGQVHASSSPVVGGIDHNDSDRTMRGLFGANSSMEGCGQPMIRVETAREPRIGKFSGDQADWPIFRDLFLTEVHNKAYDPVAKLLYLQEACTGEAKEVLGPWPPTGDNYAPAWEVMMEKYNDQYHVIHGIFRRMFATPRQDSEDHKSLHVVLNALTNCTRQLETVAPQPILWDQLCIHFAKQRLPRATLDAWEQFRNRKEKNGMPSLEEFKVFLDTKARGRREREDESAAPASTPAPGKSKSGASGHDVRSRPYDKYGGRYHNQDEQRGMQHQGRSAAPGTGPPSTCLMPKCGQTHFLGQCDSFRALSLNQRLDMVRSHRLCRCCLGQGHMAYACARPACAKCPDDKIKHHFRLCPKTTMNGRPMGADAKPPAPANH